MPSCSVCAMHDSYIRATNIYIYICLVNNSIHGHKSMITHCYIHVVFMYSEVAQTILL